MRIETRLACNIKPSASHCIQPSGWMRIETIMLSNAVWLVVIASSLRAGWGLKHKYNKIKESRQVLHPAFGLDEDWNNNTFCYYVGNFNIASSLRAGWGLKLEKKPVETFSLNCIQPSGWMRIETSLLFFCGQKRKLHPAFGLDEDWNIIFCLLNMEYHHCIQPSGWMRIETASAVAG